MKATECNESTKQRCAECGEPYLALYSDEARYTCQCGTRDWYGDMAEGYALSIHTDERVVQGEDGYLYVVEVAQ